MIYNCHIKLLHGISNKICLPLVSPLGCHRETELCLSELDPGEEAQVAGLDVGSGEGLAVAFFSVQGERTLVM